mmetsp:Transcript_21855/g.33366  ORF Transcript_21855/g.33366 Transcript_21855/m.33366 type:complete len:196 (+) Transcript_21855:65-652(+)
MSKLSDYSKFDHLVIDDDSEEKSPKPVQTPAVPTTTTRKDEKSGRYIFEHNGRKIYEWEQSLEEVNIYVPAPKNVPASQIICKITSSHLQLGIQGNDAWYLDEPTGGKVKTSESSWYMDDGEIHIILSKAFRAETWEQALQGIEPTVNPAVKQEIQQQMMLERFQEENPGFDFRDAKFNGAAPDPRTFMGGVKYS